MADQKTPPTGSPAIPPPRPIPTLATVQTTVEVLVGQVKGLRQDVEALERKVGEQTTEVIRISSVPSPASLTPTPTARPSMAAKAAKNTGKAGKWLLLGSGALTLVAQAISMFGRPEYGPLVSALRVLLAAALGGSE